MKKSKVKKLIRAAWLLGSFDSRVVESLGLILDISEESTTFLACEINDIAAINDIAFDSPYVHNETRFTKEDIEEVMKYIS